MTKTVVIVNPTKIDDLEQVRRVLTDAAAAVGVPPPELVETSEDDPGFGQTRDALAAGTQLVCALGGDGTVRAVAQELVGTGVPLGLLPGGTGNLLARNLGAPISDLAEAAEVAFVGTDRTIDVGWLVVNPDKSQGGTGVPDRAANVHCFTVMAGLGFDAEVMQDAPERLKEKVGWAAYLASGARHLTDDGFDLEISVDGASATHGDARTVLVGNCGELTGGMVLLPSAEPDDDQLDVAVLTPSSITQWVGMAARVIARRESDGPSIDRSVGRSVHLRATPPQPVEVDGDTLDDAATVRAVVQPSALVVRVPPQR